MADTTTTVIDAPTRAPKQVPPWVYKLRRALDIYTSGGAILLFEPLPEKKQKQAKKPKRTR
jgi:hypothetical protein